MKKIDAIKIKYERIKNTFNERSRRAWAASEAMDLGHGGISILMKATGLSTACFGSAGNRLNTLIAMKRATTSRNEPTKKGAPGIFTGAVSLVK